MSESDRFEWKKTIKPTIVILKLLGLWPKGDESYGKNIYTVYAIVILIIFQIGHILFQTVNLYFIRHDLKAITGSVYVELMCISIVLRGCCMMKNMKILKQLMITLNSDLFQPKNAYQRKLIRPNLDAWKKLLRILWFFAFTYTTLCSLYPILDKTYLEHRLPFPAWYPYNIRQSPHYELTYIHQVMAANILSASNVSFNSFISALNMYTAAQFDLLCDNVRNFREKDDTPSEANQKLLKCIHHHREILKFADYANRFYNWLLFVEFFVDGFSVGITMFQLTVVAPFSSEFGTLLSYANGISTQIFMYCWFGNEVEFKSSKLSYAIFESDWTGLTTEVKKNIIIFVLRAQRSLQISAFGLFNLSLENFVKIMRTAWSYFALLRQVSTRN